MALSESGPEINRPAGTGVALALALALALGLPSAPARSEAEPTAELQQIERALGKAAERRSVLEREAGALEGEILTLRRRSVQVAARAQKFESEITALEQRTEALRAEEAQKSAALIQRRGQLTAMLAALQRIARHPPTALIALPTSPVDTLRSAMLLRAAVPELERQAAALRRTLDDLSVVRQRIPRIRARLARASVGLDAERDRLEALLEGKARLASQSRTERRIVQTRMKKLAENARDLKDLLARITSARRIARFTPPGPARPPPPPAPAIVLKRPGPPVGTAKSRAKIRVDAAGGGLPVQGRIIRAFGAKDGFGGSTRGITIAGRKSARVIAPRSGLVVFAGPFRGLGQLLIIEHAEGYHTLLAGLARIDAAVGEEVLTGEPVGILALSSEGRPALYVELRRRGRPVNPLPWLTAGRTRVNG